MEPMKKRSVAAIVLAAAAVAVCIAFAGCFWTPGDIGIAFGIMILLFDVALFFWIAACLVQNNKKAFRALAVTGFAIRLLYNGFFLFTDLVIPGAIGTALNIVLILCALDVIKETPAIICLWVKLIFGLMVVGLCLLLMWTLSVAMTYTPEASDFASKLAGAVVVMAHEFFLAVSHFAAGITMIECLFTGSVLCLFSHRREQKRLEMMRQMYDEIVPQ